MRNHLNGEVLRSSIFRQWDVVRSFYMSLIGQPDEQRVATAWKAAMEDALRVKDQNHIPGA